MDLVVSRNVRLLGLVNVLGMTAAGIISSAAGDRFDSIWYLLFAAVAAGLFTLIWTFYDSDMRSLLVGQARSAYTDKRTASVSVALTVLITAVGCATVGLGAASDHDAYHARYAFVLGGLSSCVLVFYWTLADYNHVLAAKRLLTPEVY